MTQSTTTQSNGNGITNGLSANEIQTAAIGRDFRT